MKKLFFFSLISLILISIVSAQEGLLKVKINDFSGGMNSNTLADNLEPNQAASMLNVDLSRPGQMKKREGQALFNQDTGSTAFTGLGRFDPDANTSYLLIASDVQINYSLPSDTVWRRANPASPLTSGKTTEFIQADSRVFVINGFDRPGWWNGSNWTGAGEYPSSPPTASTGEWLRNYLFLSGATTETDWVYFSNNLEPEKFDASDIIKINTGDGQAVQRLLAYRLNELIIYKERSIFVMDITGDSPLSLTNGWTVQPISTTIGTPAPRSVVSLGNDQWFLSSNPIGIRSLIRTEFDKILLDSVSQPIQDIFDRTGKIKINITDIEKSTAVLFDSKYIIGIPTGTSIVNNTVLVYDFRNAAWYIITGWFPAEWLLFDERLFYIDANDGRVLEVFRSGVFSDFLEGPNIICSSAVSPDCPFGVASVPTVGIEQFMQSRALDFDQPENFKELDAISVEFDPTGNFDATVLVNLDNGGWTSVGTVNLAGRALNLPFTLPTVLSNQGVSRKTFQIEDQGNFKKMFIGIRQRGASQDSTFQRATIFARPKPWNRIQDQ